MGLYIKGPDSGNACCDCAARPDPCDTCGCSNCSGTVPPVVQIALSGYTPCNCDLYSNDPLEAFKLESWTPAATYNLTSSGPCEWSYTDTVNRADIGLYGDINCAEDPLDTATHDVVFTLTLTTGVWRLRVEAVGSLGTVVLWIGDYIHGGAPLDCTADVTVTSVHSSGVCVSGIQSCTYGGSATVDPTP